MYGTLSWVSLVSSKQMTSCLYIMITIYKAIKPKYTRNRAKGKKIKWNSKLQQWWIQGRGRPLFLDQTWGPKGRRNLFGDPPPLLISGSGCPMTTGHFQRWGDLLSFIPWSSTFQDGGRVKFPTLGTFRMSMRSVSPIPVGCPPPPPPHPPSLGKPLIGV